MPFRYVKGDDGRPIMPEVRAYITQRIIFCNNATCSHHRKGMVDLIIKDSEKSLDDLL
jgi:hypothetical protein